jgi:tetratricopeptide (TPR) repeat protein
LGRCKVREHPGDTHIKTSCSGLLGLWMRPLLAVALLLSACNTAPGDGAQVPAATSTAANALLSQGDAYTEEGYYTSAEAVFDQVLARTRPITPTNEAGDIAIVAALRLVDLYLAWGRPERGLDALQTAASLGAAPEALTERRLPLLIGAARWDDVADMAEARLDTNPGDTAALAALTQAHLERHLCDAATETARRWAGLAPVNRDAQTTSAILAGDLAQIRKTAPALAASLAVEGRTPERCSSACRLRLGLSMIRQGAWALSGCVLADVVATERPPAEAHAWLGESLRRLGYRQAAQTHLATAVELDPNSAQAWLLLGSYYLTGGQVEEARTALLNAQRLDPENPAPCLALAEVKARAGRYQEIAIWIEAALDRAPNDPEIWKTVARFYLSRNLTERGYPQDAAQAAVALAPEDPEAHALLGWSHLAEDEIGAALAALEQAVALNPAFAEAHYLRAHALRAAGRIADANEALVYAANLGHEAALDDLGLTASD